MRESRLNWHLVAILFLNLSLWGVLLTTAGSCMAR